MLCLQLGRWSDGSLSLPSFGATEGIWELSMGRLKLSFRKPCSFANILLVNKALPGCLVVGIARLKWVIAKASEDIGCLMPRCNGAR